MKKISIIMGIYNCSETLDEAIDSILHQTYPNWELIMCDDGSTDDTFQIAKKYSEKYDNIILLKNDKNQGLNYTLNKCLKAANSEYIARMDGDDISLPQRLEKEIDFLENNPEYAFVGCPMIHFDENGVFAVGKGGKEPQRNELVHGTQFSHPTVLVRRKAYDKVGGYTVNKKLLRVEDWHLWIKMYSEGLKGYILEEPFYKFRDDKNAAKRRKLKYRFNESRVILFAVKQLKQPLWKIIFAARPILVSILPPFIYKLLHQRKIGNK